ncbi:MAG: cytochrome c oxidase subunit 3 [bacterium]|nr:cytochrome c oxidase subunit 3 [bacterium]
MSEAGQQQMWNDLKKDGTKLYEEGKYEEAIQKFEQALRIQQDAEVRKMLLEAEAYLNKEKTDRSKKNLVYLGMFSVFMLFAGFTSAYIVSMGDNFWIKAPLPPAFWVSTGIIVASSVTFQLAVMFNKKGNSAALKGLITLTFLLGLGFVYFQFKGYGQLMDNGMHFTGSGVIVSDGKYEDYYTVKMNGEYLFVNGNDYYKGDKLLQGRELAMYQEFMKQFLDVKSTGPFPINTANNSFELIYRDQPMVVVDGELRMNDSSMVLPLDRTRLSALARHVVDGRGDFFVHGKMGKDFHIFYKGKEVTYKNRSLYWKGRPLDTRLQIKIQESADTSSSYLFLITFMHLLHIIITLLYLVKVVIRSFTGRINSSNDIALRGGAIFWHFLGILWVYLLLFLLYIH